MIDFAALSAPFDPEDISWRVGSTTKDKTKGMALAFVDARTVMERLDAVCGPAGWQNRYSHANGKTVCDIGILCGDAWIWKADGAGDSDIEAEKGALSDAFKRSAVRWGIGRYLYDLESPWVQLDEWKRIQKGEYKNLDMLLRRATQAILNGQQKPVNSLSQAKNDIAQMQNAGEMSSADMKTAGRLAAELWASNTLETFKSPGFDALAYGDWKRMAATPKGTKDNETKLRELREKHPDLADAIDEAASDLRVAA